MNFPVTHPMHQGGMSGPALSEADVVLVLEQDVPWMPSSGAGPSEDATVVGVGFDPLFTNFPLRSFPVHVNLTGSPRYTLEALNDALGKQSARRGWQSRPGARSGRRTTTRCVRAPATALSPARTSDR